jgi:DNA primase
VGIVDEDIARVRAATDFVALANEHMALKRVGRQYTGLCPFHGEKSPSFSLNPETGVYYCFGCQASGDVITFVRELDNLDFVGAVEALAARAGITLRYDDDATGGGKDRQRRTRIQDTLAAALAWYHERLRYAPDAAGARAYLRRERGYDSDVVVQYQLGWAPEGWSELIRSLKLSPAALADAGLAYVNDRGSYTDFFRGRLLFPIFDPNGRPLGAGGRMLPGGRPPKYKNTANTAVYDKSRTLYGLNWAKKAVVSTGQVVVCEGYTDVIGLHRAGVEEAVATCGTALADGHIRALTNFARRIVLAYDADGAGQAAAERVAEWEQRFEVDVRVAALPTGADPADLARSDPDALRSAIATAQPFLAFRLQRLFERSDLSTVEGRARAATEAMGFVGAHPNVLVRDQYVMEIADRCRLDPARLRSLPRSTPPAGGSTMSGPSRLSGATASRTSAAGTLTATRPGSTSTDRRDGGRGDGGRVNDGRRDSGRGHGDLGDDRPSGESTDALAGLSSVELEALRLAIHRPEEVADRLEAELFSHPLALAAFHALCGAATLHEAIDQADPQAALLLQRLAVEDDDGDTDAVVIRLVERAGIQALAELKAELRSADDPGAYADTLAWLKLTLEALRSDTEDDTEVARRVEGRLVGWLVERNRGE